MAYKYSAGINKSSGYARHSKLLRNVREATGMELDKILNWRNTLRTLPDNLITFMNDSYQYHGHYQI